MIAKKENLGERWNVEVRSTRNFMSGSLVTYACSILFRENGKLITEKTAKLFVVLITNIVS